jgi:hypothetical protein
MKYFGQSDIGSFDDYIKNKKLEHGSIPEVWKLPKRPEIQRPVCCVNQYKELVWCYPVQIFSTLWFTLLSVNVTHKLFFLFWQKLVYFL